MGLFIGLPFSWLRIRFYVERIAAEAKCFRKKVVHTSTVARVEYLTEGHDTSEG